MSITAHSTALVLTVANMRYSQGYGTTTKHGLLLCHHWSQHSTGTDCGKHEIFSSLWHHNKVWPNVLSSLITAQRWYWLWLFQLTLQYNKATFCLFDDVYQVKGIIGHWKPQKYLRKGWICFMWFGSMNLGTHYTGITLSVCPSVRLWTE